MDRKLGIGRLALGILLLSIVTLPSLWASSDAAAKKQRATQAVRTLQSWYDSDTGLYHTTGWWNSANAITTLADYSRIAGSHKYKPVFRNTLSAAQKKFPGFINEFYDDEGWWALAWIDVYDLTHDEQYLGMAQSIFQDMAGGWDTTCSGGIWWSKKRKYKNAIANELFLSVAAHLASRAKNSDERARYSDWAQKEWAWFHGSGMINAEHLINDGLDASCANNHRTTWSYNQGVILGALAEMYSANHDQQLLADAQTIASATLSSPLVDANGILHDPCEPKCGEDAPQFKGIFMRNLRALDEVSPSPQYEQFINANADSIWSGSHPPDYHLGLIWASPFGSADASTHSSATDVLVAALQISKRRTPASGKSR